MPPSNILLRSVWLSSRSSQIFSPTTATAIATARFTPPKRTLTTTRPVLSVEKANEQSPVISSSTISQNTVETLAGQASSSAGAVTPPSSEETMTETSLKKKILPSDITIPQSRQQNPYTIKVGTVTSVGLMDKTVRVAYHHRQWDRHIRKWYPKVTTYLVSDPQNSLREGDVIEFSSGERKSRRVRHVVDRIIAPFGVGIDERPPVLSREEREAQKVEKRKAKIVRRMERVAEEAVDENGEVLQDKIEGEKRRLLERQFHVGRIKRLVEKRVKSSSIVS